MTIICDQHIPFLVEAVQHKWPQVHIYPMKSEEINAEAVRNADVLVVRTRTQVNEQLLAGSRVQLVCTATIGFDHIDTAYCDTHHIDWMSCPGCNAQAVCDYIEEA
ncbi:MAG: erythronate-4-phosphate dehydrogenase, partial [Paludibacteraceae bacterium]|nr:erythronate-4-phosphate dehydrogenase [Paludibacteraceae bacterium]